MASRSASSSESTLGGHLSSSASLGGTPKNSSPIVHRPPDATAPSPLASAQPVESLEDLPEELIASILSHMDDKELLLCTLISRSMNRLAVQLLLFRHDIVDPTDSTCKVVLTFEAPKDSTDALTALRHSMHIKDMKRLDIHFTQYPTAHSLVSPLRQLLRVLHNIDSVVEMALTLPWHLTRNATPASDKSIKEVVLAFQEVLNQAILRSCRRLYLHGSHNFMQQVYRFRGGNSSPLNPSPGGGRKLLQSFIGARDYIDRRKEKKADDSIIQDDLRYSRSTISGSRIFAHCSSLALSRTPLTHIELNTLNLLRPPFSQWMFPMLRASPITYLNLQSAAVPQDTQELDFILARLAAVLPTLHSLHFYGLTISLLRTFVKFVNLFRQLVDIRVAYPMEDSRAWQSFASIPPLNDHLNSDYIPALQSLAPTLCVIDGQVHFLTWLFQTACPKKPEPCRPKLPTDTANIAPLLPSLRKVHIDYFCEGGIAFQVPTLAKAIRLIQESLDSSSELMAPRVFKTRVVVHLKFDMEFRGLLPSWSRGDSGVSHCSPALKAVAGSPLTCIEGDDANTRWLESAQVGPDPDPQPKTVKNLDAEDSITPGDPDHGPPQWNGGETDEESDPDSANLALLATVKVMSVILPCLRKDILDGRFKAKILGILTIFWGVEHMDLMSSEAYTRFEYVTPRLSGSTDNPSVLPLYQELVRGLD